MESVVFKCIVPSHVVPAYDEKYLLVRVTDARKAGKVTWVVVSRPMPYHSDILADFEQGLYSPHKEVTVCGGGILRIKDGAVSTFGRSGGFGAVAKEHLPIVERCLRACDALQQLSITVGVSNYVRD